VLRLIAGRIRYRSHADTNLFGASVHQFCDIYGHTVMDVPGAPTPVYHLLSLIHLPRNGRRERGK
jgi:hypothetical protein